MYEQLVSLLMINFGILLSFRVDSSYVINLFIIILFSERRKFLALDLNETNFKVLLITLREPFWREIENLRYSTKYYDWFRCWSTYFLKIRLFFTYFSFSQKIMNNLKSFRRRIAPFIFLFFNFVFYFVMWKTATVSQTIGLCSFYNFS